MADHVEDYSDRLDSAHSNQCPRCLQRPADVGLLGRPGEGHVCGECWLADREADAKALRCKCGQPFPATMVIERRDCTQPHLGLATTRELLDELRARFEVHAEGGLDYKTFDPTRDAEPVSPLGRRVNAEHQAKVASDAAIERRAKEIYNGFPYFDDPNHPAKPAWVDGGNSDQQDVARRLARQELETYVTTPTERPWYAPGEQPVLVDDSGVVFNGRAERVGDTWSYRSADGKRYPLRPQNPQVKR